MSNFQTLLNQVGRIKSATANVAQDVRNLTAKITTGMTQEQVDALAAELEATASQLEAVADETEDETTEEEEAPEEETEE